MSAPYRIPPPPPCAQPTLVTIDRIGAEGDGVGRLPDGTPLYVPLTLPGEHITAGRLRRRGEGWHAAAASIDAPSPDRVRPPCRHFGPCGGCALQHWQDAAYRVWKAGLLEAALRSAGFIPPGPIELIPGLPGERRRLDFAVRRAGGRIILGLHGPRSAEVVDLTACLVLHPTLLALLAPLRALLHGLRAIRRQGNVVVNLLDSGPDLLLRSDGAPSLEDRVALTAFARAHGLPRVSWAHVGDSGARPGGDIAETICLLRPATTTLSGIAVRPPPGAFLQATEAGECAIVEAVLRGLPERLTSRPSGARLTSRPSGARLTSCPSGARLTSCPSGARLTSRPSGARLISRPSGRPRIAELYAGNGSLTFALAGAVAGERDGAQAGQFRVAAWEGDAASVDALKEAINQGGLAGRVEATRRDLARQPLSVKELSGFAAVVLDPPHGGAAAQIAQIAAAGVPTVVYVSCNPVTLGRDAKVLHAAGYALGAATAIDQFLWSAQLESVCVFRR